MKVGYEVALTSMDVADAIEVVVLRSIREQGCVLPDGPLNVEILMAKDFSATVRVWPAAKTEEKEDRDNIVDALTLNSCSFEGSQRFTCLLHTGENARRDGVTTCLARCQGELESNADYTAYHCNHCDFSYQDEGAEVLNYHCNRDINGN